MSFIFDQLALTPPNKCFKVYFKSFFESILLQKTVTEVLKMWYFFILHFGLQAQGGGTNSVRRILKRGGGQKL